MSLQGARGGITEYWDITGLLQQGANITITGSGSLTDPFIISGTGGGGVAWGAITGTLSAQTDLQTALNAKQALLVSGTNIKTINGSSILGSGNLAISTSPGGSTTNVQINKAGVFYADANFTYNDTTKEVVITGDPSTFIADPANTVASIEYDPSYYYDNTGKWDVNARVYAYRIVSAVKYFSAMYAEGTTVTADQSGIPFRAVYTWDAVPGADGYRVVLLNGSPTSPAPFNYDYYVDVATNALTDNGDQAYFPYVDGVDNIPVGTENAVNNLQVLGRSYFNQTAQHAARVIIDTTGGLTIANEALQVAQNVEIDGVLGVGGATDLNSFINISRTGANSIVLVDGVERRGINVAMSGIPTADVTGSMTGAYFSITAPASGFTNGGIQGLVVNVSDSSNSTGAVVGQNIAVSSAGSSASPSQMYGVFMAASKASSGNASIIDGARIVVNIGAGGNIGDAYGGEFILSQNSNNNVANITNARGGFFNLTLNGEGATTDGASGYFRLVLAKGGSVVGTASSAAIIKGDLSVSGGFAPTTLYGLFLPNITGGATNYSIWSAGGKAHIEGAIDQGSSQQFQLDTTGNIIKLNNVTTSFPSSQGSADRYYRNDGSGNITWAQVSLSAGVTGTLPIANGGTGQTTLNAAGIPQVIASADLTAQSAAVSSVVTTTAPNDGSSHTYMIGGYITVTAISVNTITLAVDYTDETSTSRTQNFFGEGLTTAAISTTGSFPFPPMTIRAKQNTAITVKTVVTGIGSETYDTGGFILRIN